MKTKLPLLFLLFCGIANAQTYTFNTVTPIPDGTGTSCGSGNSAGNVSVSLNVPITATITDPTKVTINLDLVHTWLGDVVAELGTPAGGSCALIKRLGAATDTSCGDSSDFATGNVLSFNAANTTAINVVTPGAAQSIPAGAYAPTGGTSTYPTDIPLCNLTTFLNGVAVNGDWTMTLYDNGEEDTGSLNAWQIIFTTGFDLNTQDFLFTKRISVLGNPFNEALTLKLNEAGNTSTVLRIFSIDGREVFNKSYASNDAGQTISIETGAWQQGIYMLVPEIDGRRLNAIKLAKK
ncbi:putative secreted protein (Por secretion system target) [Flavobacterium endophyticum]|uniref:Putative secreted protein (Por secretion system target) n=1 Tax=Flavobacterium endophyticum TaxID=1540163 RepID=A0A495MNA6_9FLAO|nr:T9SS type A sorting domain-containing protein [Flavobacterium endophyticum]RKS26860.1 putative secreted protein (Por secretion system target) [Flavobacterium endophyticum]